MRTEVEMIQFAGVICERMCEQQTLDKRRLKR